MAQKSELMGIAVRHGVTGLEEIRNMYEDGGWTLQDESNYNIWKSNLPENLRNTNENDYNMRLAFKTGMQPELNEDGYYHLFSRDPKTGTILKTPHHPTYLKALLEDAKMGYYPTTKNGITKTNTWSGNQTLLNLLEEPQIPFKQYNMGGVLGSPSL